jgi:hypothetical protein
LTAGLFDDAFVVLAIGPAFDHGHSLIGREGRSFDVAFISAVNLPKRVERSKMLRVAMRSTVPFQSPPGALICSAAIHREDYSRSFFVAA